MTVAEMASVVRKLMPYIAGAKKMHREELCALLRPIARIMPAPSSERRMSVVHTWLKYDGQNSCYLDSLLTALFHDDFPWVTKTLLRIKDSPLTPSLQRIFTLMRLPNLPAPLLARIVRLKLNDSFDDSEIDWLRNQCDPNDVLRVMNLPSDVRVKVTLSDGEQRKEKWAMNAFAIERERLARGKKLNIGRMFPEFPLAHGSKALVTKARALYIPVERAIHQVVNSRVVEKKLQTSVKGPSMLRIGSDELKLRAILVHNGKSTQHGHYTAVIRRNKTWKLYDDMSNGEPKRIASSTKDLWSMEDGYISRNVAGFFYC